MISIPGEPRGAGPEDKQSPQGTETQATLKQRWDLSVAQGAERAGGEWTGRGSLTARTTPGVVWVPLLELGVLDRPLSKGSDGDCRGPGPHGKLGQSPFRPGGMGHLPGCGKGWPRPLSHGRLEPQVTTATD